MSHCRHTRSPAACLCAWPGITPTEYQALLEARFWAKVNKQTNDGCWEWTASLAGARYGAFWNGVRQVPAHRYSLELVIGPIPSHLFVDHRCRNTRCVNPDHLRVVTNKQNIEHLAGASVSNKSSGFRNVSRHKKGWKVEVRDNGTKFYFGTYDTAEEANEVAVLARQVLFTHDDYGDWVKRQSTTRRTARHLTGLLAKEN